jgi:Cys-rich repeat protein
MKKSILNLGKALNKTEQKSINGGKRLAPECISDSDCNNGEPVVCSNGYKVVCSNSNQCELATC